MCYVDLDPAEVWHEKERKARKTHICSCCGRTIQVGEVYTVHFSVLEGQVDKGKMCNECKADRKEFGDAHDSMISSPRYFRTMLQECIYEGDDEDSQWKPMLERMKARGGLQGATGHGG